MDNKLKQFLENLPNSEDGWWDRANYLNWQRLAQRMIDAGIPPNEAEELLHNAYWSVAAEYDA